MQAVRKGSESEGNMEDMEGVIIMVYTATHTCIRIYTCVLAATWAYLTVEKWNQIFAPILHHTYVRTCALYTCMYAAVIGVLSWLVQDHACLHFTPPIVSIPPHSVTTVTVECCPHFVGRLRSIVQCVVEGKVIQWVLGESEEECVYQYRHRKFIHVYMVLIMYDNSYSMIYICRCVSVHAEAQRPAVTLAQCQLHEDTVYVGVETERRVELINTSLIPTHFTWSTQVQYTRRMEIFSRKTIMYCWIVRHKV